MAEKIAKLKQEDVINKFVELHGGTKTAAKEEMAKAFGTVTALLNEGVEAGVKVPITDFGSFTAKMSKARTQNNALVGGVIDIPSKPQVSFKKSSKLV